MNVLNPHNLLKAAIDRQRKTLAMKCESLQTASETVPHGAVEAFDVSAVVKEVLLQKFLRSMRSIHFFFANGSHTPLSFVIKWKRLKL